jgi:crotonobetainyl-CoA:carnitine CoA-transferase CaiB-like acyl-CoA transferase
MAVGTDRQYADYCKLIGAPELGSDARFVKNTGRVENRDVLIPLLAPFMRNRTTAEWITLFEPAAIPCGPINTIDQVFSDEQVLARGLQIGLTRDDGVQVPGVANPIVFSGTPVEYEAPPPLLGAGTTKVLTDVLGLTPAEIASLTKSKSVF